MSDFNAPIKNCGFNDNKNLYKLLATDYDISTLARKIDADQKSSMSIWNLKKIVKSA